MNADSKDTRFPHLDLGDLVAEANDQPLDDRVREHLDSCAACQLEVNRWSLVADGVRGLAADVSDAAPDALPSERPRRAAGRVLRRPVRSVMASACGVAAALVLLLVVGTATGLVHVHLSNTNTGTGGSGSGGTTLTSVTGCARLEQTKGTLERVDGSNVVIKTASGQLVTVTATASTKLAASGALRGDITDGATVVVAGASSGGTIAADYVIVGTRASLTVRGVVIIRGTVSDAGAGGFTVVTSAGTRVAVTTSGTTEVSVIPASLDQLPIGGSTIALGYAGPDGTLSGLAVLQPPDWPAGAHASASVSSCSRGAITKEVLALASGG